MEALLSLGVQTVEHSDGSIGGRFKNITLVGTTIQSSISLDLKSKHYPSFPEYRALALWVEIRPEKPHSLSALSVEKAEDAYTH